MTRVPYQWIPPAPGSFRLILAAYEQKTDTVIGIGGLVRDHQGRMLEGFASSTMSEAHDLQAITKGLEFCQRRRLMQIEVDIPPSCHHLISGYVCPWREYWLHSRIRSAIEESPHVKLPKSTKKEQQAVVFLEKWGQVLTAISRMRHKYRHTRWRHTHKTFVKEANRVSYSFSSPGFPSYPRGLPGEVLRRRDDLASSLSGVRTGKSYPLLVRMYRA